MLSTFAGAGRSWLAEVSNLTAAAPPSARGPAAGSVTGSAQPASATRAATATNALFFMTGSSARPREAGRIELGPVDRLGRDVPALEDLGVAAVGDHGVQRRLVRR